MGVLTAYMPVYHMCAVTTETELELEMIVSHHVNAGN